MSLTEKLMNVDINSIKVKHLIVIDWYDGYREGLCELETPPCCFYFSLLDERPTPDDLDDRFLQLTELSADEYLLIRNIKYEKEVFAQQLERIKKKKNESDPVIWTRDMKKFFRIWSNQEDWNAWMKGA